MAGGERATAAGPATAAAGPATAVFPCSRHTSRSGSPAARHHAHVPRCCQRQPAVLAGTPSLWSPAVAWRMNGRPQQPGTPPAGGCTCWTHHPAGSTCWRQHCGAARVPAAVLAAQVRPWCHCRYLQQHLRSRAATTTGVGMPAADAAWRWCWRQGLVLVLAPVLASGACSWVLGQQRHPQVDSWRQLTARTPCAAAASC